LLNPTPKLDATIVYFPLPALREITQHKRIMKLNHYSSCPSRQGGKPHASAIVRFGVAFAFLAAVTVGVGYLLGSLSAHKWPLSGAKAT
jgi:hypothetical protein